MNDASDDLLARLRQPGALAIDCLATPRLPTLFLVQAWHRIEPVQLQRVSDDCSWALQLLGLADRFGVTAPLQLPLRSVPFQLSLDDHGAVTVTIDRLVLASKILPDSGSHSWIRGLATHQLVVDFAAVDMVNSVLVAWLLQLTQSAKPAAIVVRNTRSSIATQFRQLRLDQMMTIS